MSSLQPALKVVAAPSEDRSAKNDKLADITRTLVGDVVKELRPTWWTEDCCNLDLAKNGSFTFRYDRKSYLTTLIVSKKGSFAHHTISEASKHATANLAARISDLEVCDGASQEVDAAFNRLIGRKKISGLSVSLSSDSEPDSVRLLFNDGSFVIMAFKPASLIAVDHTTKNEQKAVYGAAGRDVSNKRLDLVTTACTGQETIVTRPIQDPVFTIPLPPIPSTKRL